MPQPSHGVDALLIYSRHLLLARHGRNAANVAGLKSATRMRQVHHISRCQGGASS